MTAHPDPHHHDDPRGLAGARTRTFLVALPESAQPVRIEAGPAEYAAFTRAWRTPMDGRVDPFTVLGTGDARPRDERSPISQERNR